MKGIDGVCAGVCRAAWNDDDDGDGLHFCQKRKRKMRKTTNHLLPKQCRHPRQHQNVHRWVCLGFCRSETEKKMMMMKKTKKRRNARTRKRRKKRKKRKTTSAIETMTKKTRKNVPEFSSSSFCVFCASSLEGSDFLCQCWHRSRLQIRRRHLRHLLGRPYRPVPRHLPLLPPPRLRVLPTPRGGVGHGE
jgi:hypothetical protein